MILIDWNDQRENIFKDRYALKDENDNLLEEVPSQMWSRIAKTMAFDARDEAIFHSILEDFKFVPSGRILAGGRTFYNCFVIGFKNQGDGADSRSSIMTTIGDIIEITARGGGVGVNWSTLRPRDTHIRGVQGKSSGSICWMRGADALANAIRQGGTRTAALMFIIDDWHPDVVELTRTGSRFQRTNFSINISHQFIDAVSRDAEWLLIFPDTTSPYYDLEWDGDIHSWKRKGLPIIHHDTVKARDLWRAMAESAYMIGSPGMAFIDRCNEWSNTRYLHRLVCFNPCGEQPLPVDGSCNLGAINLLAFANRDGCIQYDHLDLAIRSAIRFLDRVIDMSEDINPHIGNLQRHVRRIGLGTMGLADLLILNGIKYGSDASLEFIDNLFSFIRDSAYQGSVNLAREKGPAPGFSVDEILASKFIKTLPGHIRDGIAEYGLRNLALLTQAPTGTTSLLAGASSGIEPIFSREFIRKDATGCASIRHPLADDPVMVTAKEIEIEKHILVQATLQKYVDSSISKTINLPKDCSVKDITSAFQLAYDSGCKGVTVYRATSLDDVLCESCSL